MKKVIRIGTRGSDLALYQARLVAALVQQKFPACSPEIVVIKTSGDEGSRRFDSQDDPFATKRIFTREIEQALFEKKIDAAVHSAKDMAVPCPEGLKIAAVPAREDSRDCLISYKFNALSQMPEGSILGTSSLRRKTQASRLNPNLVIREIHGNVGTRMRKCREGEYDAIILAAAGMKRLKLEHEVTEFFQPENMLPAPGQGIIAVQIREDDSDAGTTFSQINDPQTFVQLECERAFLKKLEGGCQLPCGVSTAIDGNQLTMKGILLSPFEKKWVEAECQGSINQAVETGITLAQMILDRGGSKILESIKRQ